MYPEQRDPTEDYAVSKEQRIKEIVASVVMQMRPEEAYALAVGKMTFEMKMFIKGLKKVLKD